MNEAIPSTLAENWWWDSQIADKSNSYLLLYWTLGHICRVGMNSGFLAFDELCILIITLLQRITRLQDGKIITEWFLMQPYVCFIALLEEWSPVAKESESF